MSFNIIFKRPKAENGAGRAVKIKHVLLPEEVVKDLKLFKGKGNMIIIEFHLKSFRNTIADIRFYLKIFQLKVQLFSRDLTIRFFDWLLEERDKDSL